METTDITNQPITNVCINTAKLQYTKKSQNSSTKYYSTIRPSAFG